MEQRQYTGDLEILSFFVVYIGVLFGYDSTLIAAIDAFLGIGSKVNLGLISAFVAMLAVGITHAVIACRLTEAGQD